MNNKNPIAYLAVALAFCGCVGCNCTGCKSDESKSSTPVATTNPANPSSDNKPVSYSSKKFGIQVQYPTGWVARANKDYEAFLVPAALDAKAEPTANISLDIPELPLHIPGMIPMGLTKDGYLDDLKKEFGTITTVEKDHSLPASTAKMLTSTWQKDGKTFRDKALVIIHNDHVYILRARSEGDEKAIEAAFDQMVGTLQWIK